MPAAPCLWLTGPAGAGKSTIARAVAEVLGTRGRPIVVLDDEEVRAHLDPGDPLAALTWLAGILTRGGAITIVAVNEPRRAARERVREELPWLVEVHVDPGSDDSGYEEPFAAELRVPTHDRDAAASTAQVISWLERTGVLAPDPS